MDALLDEAVQRRLERALAGEPGHRELLLDRLQPGDVGVLRARVVHAGAPRTYGQGGRQGRMARVRLQGIRCGAEADLVLWDDEVELLRTVPLEPHVEVELRGAQARAGWREGVELGITGGEAVAVGTPALPPGWAVLRRVDFEYDGAEPVARAQLEGREGVWRIDVRGPRAAFLDHGVGARLKVSGTQPHPALAGWRLASDAFRVEADPQNAGRNR